MKNVKKIVEFTKSDEIPYWDKIFGEHNWKVEKGAQVGKANGLSILLVNII